MPHGGILSDIVNAHHKDRRVIRVVGILLHNKDGLKVNALVADFHTEVKVKLIPDVIFDCVTSSQLCILASNCHIDDLETLKK